MLKDWGQLVVIFFCIPYTITLYIIIYTNNRGYVYWYYLYAGNLILNTNLTPITEYAVEFISWKYFTACYDFRTFYTGFIIYKYRTFFGRWISVCIIWQKNIITVTRRNTLVSVKIEREKENDRLYQYYSGYHKRQVVTLAIFMSHVQNWKDSFHIYDRIDQNTRSCSCSGNLISRQWWFCDVQLGLRDV